jgi:hypothetical protein
MQIKTLREQVDKEAKRFSSDKNLAHYLHSNNNYPPTMPKKISTVLAVKLNWK